MELRKSKSLQDIASALATGKKFEISRGVDDPILLRCPRCHLELAYYQRHKHNQLPLEYKHDDLYRNAIHVELPEETANHKAEETDFFGLDAYLLEGVCPQCETEYAGIWVACFPDFPKPNILRGHPPESETLYRLNPKDVVIDFARCDIRAVSLDGRPVGVVWCYKKALIDHEAFTGYPSKDFYTNAVFFRLDCIATRALNDENEEGLENAGENYEQLRMSDVEDVESVVRELLRAVERIP